MNAIIANLKESLVAAATLVAGDVRLWVLCIVLPFIVTLLLVPWLVVRLPATYFSTEKRKPLWWKNTHPVLRILLLIVKNLVGLLVMLMGLAMLVLPGQGLLTLLMGLMLLDFPGKYHWERWLVTRKPVWHSVNWLRGKRGRPPFEL